jgi:putative phosphoribosyl transferase
VADARAVEIPLEDGLVLHGDLAPPQPEAGGVVVFAHGTGSSRHSPRNRQVAARLQADGLGTLLLDLLTEREEAVDVRTRHHRFDIALLSDRLVVAADWMGSQPPLRTARLGYFGASTGAAAALVAAARQPDRISAIVSRGGRPDLAAEALPVVRAPTLLVVGERDEMVLALNREAAAGLRCPHRIEVVPGASHLFEEPGALERVAELAADWFAVHLAPDAAYGTKSKLP